jgi:hypothetical protein
MSRNAEQDAPNRVVNYKAALKYVQERGLGLSALTDSGFRSRIARGTVPVEPMRPQVGGRRMMFDLDKLDLWLEGKWRKGAEQ